MISYIIDGQKFNYRIAGITIREGRVLLHRLAHDTFWALPGGRGEMGESSQETLVREYEEEIGAEVTVGRLVFAVENFFKTRTENLKVHELSMMYEVSFPENSPFVQQMEFQGQEGAVDLVFKWIPLAELADMPVYPAFLKEKLRNLPLSAEHVVNVDESWDATSQASVEK